MHTSTMDFANAYVALRDVLGYIENGSSTVVTIFQDDATHIWCVKVGKQSFYDDSLIKAIHKAHAVFNELIKPKD